MKKHHLYSLTRQLVVVLPNIAVGYPIEFIQKGTAGWVKEWAE